MTGQRRRRIGKDGERFAKRDLSGFGFYFADTAIAGLAGDDAFVRAPNGRWMSVEVKNTMQFLPKYLAQTRKQAAERFDAIQEKMRGPHAEIFYALGMDKYRKTDWMLMWHPRTCGVAVNSWCVFYGKNGRTAIATVDDAHGFDFL